MKRRHAFVLTTALVIAALLFALPEFTRLVLRSRLQQLLSCASVSVGKVTFHATGAIGVSDLKISCPTLFALDVKKLRVILHPADLMRGRVLSVVVDGARVKADTGSQNATSLLSLLSNKRGGGGAFAVGTVEFSGIDVSLESADISVDGRIAGVIDLPRQELESLELRLGRFRMRELEVRGAAILIPAGRAGTVSADEVAYNKLVLRAVKGTALLTGKTLSVEELRADILKGSMIERGSVDLVWPIRYASVAEFRDLDLTEFAEAFDLKKKVALAGVVRGSLHVEGTGDRITHISGDVAAGADGGRLTITDTRFLENMAKSAGSSLDIVMESFRNYRYNTGSVKLAVAGRDLTLNTSLDGPAGKRELTVVLHDIILGKER